MLHCKSNKCVWCMRASHTPQYFVRRVCIERHIGWAINRMQQLLIISQLMASLGLWLVYCWLKIVTKTHGTIDVLTIDKLNMIDCKC
jgi:hypothetical protein